MPFKLNDYVRVKPGVLLVETGEPVPGWEGEITEVPASLGDQVYLVELDALSLNQLPEKYLADCIEEGDLAIAYYFAEEDLEASIRRDSHEQRVAAHARLEDLFFPPAEDEFGLTQITQWQREFEQSPQYTTLGLDAQESAQSIIVSFAEYAFNYRSDQPSDWTLGTLREVCLELFPRKFSAEIEFFEHIGLVLNQFFGFLDEKKYLKNAGHLQEEMRKIAPQIISRAKNPQNWGMAKSFAMGAIAAGVDLSDTNAMNGFMDNFNANLLPNLEFPELASKKPQRLRSVHENPFKNIARNQVVKVEYPDGSIREGKFKRLEEALRTGKCVLLA
ncbi:MAG: hypothetical protein Q7T20_13450 [Saprospiraceae bacterium]|nr:hypothetical protein [Saprospiraceae bacterium]